MEPGGLQKEKGPKAQDRKRRAGRDDVVRSCLPSSVALYWKLESKLVQKFKQQVRAADQAAYPEVTIESFVGYSSMGLLCPPAQNMSKRIPVTTRGTHTGHPVQRHTGLTSSIVWSCWLANNYLYKQQNDPSASVNYVLEIACISSFTVSTVNDQAWRLQMDGFTVG